MLNLPSKPSLSVQFNGVKCFYIVVQQISRTFSSCKACRNTVSNRHQFTVNSPTSLITAFYLCFCDFDHSRCSLQWSQSSSFCGWRIWLSTVSSRVEHVQQVAGSVCSTATWCSIVCLSHVLASVHLWGCNWLWLVWRHRGELECAPLSPRSLGVLWDAHLQVGCWVWWCRFWFGRTLPSVFRSRCASSPSCCWRAGLRFLCILANTRHFLLFAVVIPIGVWSRLVAVLIFISFIMHDVEYRLMCLFSICMSSLKKYLFKSFVHFSNGLLDFSLLTFLWKSWVIAPL